MRKAGQFLKKFARDRRGSPAVEFAMIAPLLFASTFGTFEVGRGLYERNKVSSAAALATRAVALHGANDDDAIEAAIRQKLGIPQGDPRSADLRITLSSQTIAGQQFKKIDIAYDHDLLINLGGNLSGFTFHITRYTMAVTL